MNSVKLLEGLNVKYVLHVFMYLKLVVFFRQPRVLLEGTSAPIECYNIRQIMDATT